MLYNPEAPTDHPAVERTFEPLLRAEATHRQPRDINEATALAGMHNFLASFLSSPPAPREPTP